MDTWYFDEGASLAVPVEGSFGDLSVSTKSFRSSPKTKMYEGSTILCPILEAR